MVDRVAIATCRTRADSADVPAGAVVEVVVCPSPEFVDAELPLPSVAFDEQETMAIEQTAAASAAPTLGCMTSLLQSSFLRAYSMAQNVTRLLGSWLGRSSTGGFLNRSPHR